MAQGGDRVRVVVADDHPLFREGVARAVGAREDFELVGEAADGNEALELIRSLAPEANTLQLCSLSRRFAIMIWSSTCWCTVALTIGSSASTRRSRLRGMRSAEDR